MTSKAVDHILSPVLPLLVKMPTPTKIKRFYQSAKWKKVRRLKIQKARGICEECGQAGWEVHHIIPLTLANIDDPEIALGLDNLQLLCTKCHNAKRSEEKEIRSDVMFDKDGNLIKKEKHPPTKNG